MPTSGPDSLTYICQRIIDLQPKSVLDVGVGFGKWGFLVREYTELWKKENPVYKQEGWTTKIDGIEPFKDYIQDYHSIFYDTIYFMDVLEFFSIFTGVKVPDYDFIICCDVLEHLSEVAGIKLLEEMKNHGRTSILSVPIIVRSQEEEFNNIYEKHRSQWAKWYLEQYGKVNRCGKSLVLEMKNDLS